MSITVSFVILIYLLFTRNGSIKKEIQKKKNKKYTITKSESTKKPICIEGYFHNILLSVIFIFICKQGNNTKIEK